MSNTTLSFHRVVSVDLGVAVACNTRSPSPTYFTQHILLKTEDGSIHDLALFWEDGLTPNLLVGDSK